MIKQFFIWTARSVVVIICAVFSNPLFSTEKLNEHFDVGLQYRIMYNNSNIRAADQYDFFRQRLRLWTDFHPEKNIGGYIQLEYRGGSGVIFLGEAGRQIYQQSDSYVVNEIFGRLQLVF